MSENSKKILNYLKQNDGVNLTAADVADALGLDKKVVNGAFTSAIQRKTLGERVESERQLSDGTHEKVKYLKLTQAGMDFDPDADAE